LRRFTRTQTNKQRSITKNTNTKNEEEVHSFKVGFLNKMEGGICRETDVPAQRVGVRTDISIGGGNSGIRNVGHSVC